MSNKANARPLSKSWARQRKGTAQQSVVSMMPPVRAICPADPPQVLNNIRVTQKFMGIHTVPGTTGYQTVTVADLAAFIPGGTTYWQAVRFENFQIWGNESSTLTTPVSPLSVQVGGSATTGRLALHDDGTTGQRRSAVAFKLGLLERARWTGPATAQVLFSVAGAATPRTITIAFTCELESPSGLPIV